MRAKHTICIDLHSSWFQRKQKSKGTVPLNSWWMTFLSSWLIMRSSIFGSWSANIRCDLFQRSGATAAWADASGGGLPTKQRLEERPERTQSLLRPGDSPRFWAVPRRHGDLLHVFGRQFLGNSWRHLFLQLWSRDDFQLLQLVGDYKPVEGYTCRRRTTCTVVAIFVQSRSAWQLKRSTYHWFFVANNESNHGTLSGETNWHQLQVFRWLHSWSVYSSPSCSFAVSRLRTRGQQK